MLVKHRIMTRGRIAAILSARMSNDEKEYKRFSSDDRQQAERDMLFHMLADGKDVKISNDVNMGGAVVEYDDGN